MLTLFDVHMPHMGSVEFALLTEWLLKPGDRVAEGDPLCEVSTDKVDTEVDSPTSGILISYVAAVDQEVPVGDVIARFASLDADPVAVAQAIAGEDAVGEDVAPAAPTSGPIAGPFPDFAGSGSRERGPDSRRRGFSPTQRFTGVGCVVVLSGQSSARRKSTPPPRFGLD
ncbi:biotin/lipoyl-containing protein [Rhodococcus sp. 2.95]